MVICCILDITQQQKYRVTPGEGIFRGLKRENKERSIAGNDNDKKNNEKTICWDGWNFEDIIVCTSVWLPSLYIRHTLVVATKRKVCGYPRENKKFILEKEQALETACGVLQSNPSGRCRTDILNRYNEGSKSGRPHTECLGEQGHRQKWLESLCPWLVLQRRGYEHWLTDLIHILRTLTDWRHILWTLTD